MAQEYQRAIFAAHRVASEILRVGEYPAEQIRRIKDAPGIPFTRKSP